MKIVTVNVPESYVDAMEKLVGEDGLYPSRSELIRCAVREFLIKELKLAKNMTNFSDSLDEEFDDFNMNNDKFVRIPIEKKDKNEGSKIEFKTYKIVRRLEY
ncbi:MAG: ribbon-helix-helix domain-containing protein [Promethearchaeota archaeon]